MKVFATQFQAQCALANKIQDEKHGRRWCISKDCNGWWHVVQDDGRRPKVYGHGNETLNRPPPKKDWKEIYNRARGNLLRKLGIPHGYDWNTPHEPGIKFLICNTKLRTGIMKVTNRSKEQRP